MQEYYHFFNTRRPYFVRTCRKRFTKIMREPIIVGVVTLASHICSYIPQVPELGVCGDSFAAMSLTLVVQLSLLLVSFTSVKCQSKLPGIYSSS